MVDPVVNVAQSKKRTYSILRRIGAAITLAIFFMPWVGSKNFFELGSLSYGGVTIYSSSLAVFLIFLAVVGSLMAVLASSDKTAGWGTAIGGLAVIILVFVSPVVHSKVLSHSNLSDSFTNAIGAYFIAMIVVSIFCKMERSVAVIIEDKAYSQPVYMYPSPNQAMRMSQPNAVRVSDPNKYWHCYQCGTSNIVAKNACVRCGMPKPIVTTTVQSEPEPVNQGRKIWKCPHCNVGNSFANPICSRCGYQPDEDARLCSSCGAANRGNNKFCNKCGALIE